MHWLTLVLIAGIPIGSIFEFVHRLICSLSTPRYLGFVVVFFAFLAAVLWHHSATPDRFDPSAAVIMLIPWAQLALIQVAQLVFKAHAGRSPATFDRAKWGHDELGRRMWPDKFYWVGMLVLAGLSVFFAGWAGRNM
jgi:hypothetical protein